MDIIAITIKLGISAVFYTMAVGFAYEAFNAGSTKKAIILLILSGVFMDKFSKAANDFKLTGKK